MALLQLQQGHQLQGLHLVRFAAQNHAQLPFSAAAIALIAPQLRQQQPQRPALRFPIRQRLQQGDRLVFAVEGDQQLQQPLLFAGAGFLALEPLSQPARFSDQRSGARIIAVAPGLLLPQPPAPRCRQQHQGTSQA